MKISVPLLVAGAFPMVTARPWARALTTYFFTLYKPLSSLSRNIAQSKDFQIFWILGANWSHKYSGDSYSQTGFYPQGEQPSGSNPMGNPALGTGTTTGGINWVGYLTTEQNASLVYSYDFAIGGAALDNSIVSSYGGDVVSQVESFEDAYGSQPASTPWTADDGVFSFWIGINDVGNAFSSTDANTVVPQLMDRLQSLAQQIYSLGGRKFLFLNVPPTNRTPNFINQGEEAQSELAAYLEVYNDQLKTMVASLASNDTSVTAVLYDSWTFMTGILDNPTEYGFQDASCINDDGVTCVWWNDYHPSAKYHELQAEDMKSVLALLGAW